MQRLIRDYPFATLVTARAPEPQISHLPLLFHSAPEPNGVLIGHMARANPHWRQFADGPTMALFHGPHAYVSPSWYAEPEKAVPTWNYAVVHASSRRVVEDRAATLAILHEMIERLIRSAASGGCSSRAGSSRRMVNAIVAWLLIEGWIPASCRRSECDRSPRGLAHCALNNPPKQALPPDWMQPYAGEADPRVRLDKCFTRPGFTRPEACRTSDRGGDAARRRPARQASYAVKTGARISLRKDAMSEVGSP